MPRLFCARRRGHFRPRLTIERTGYSQPGTQWVYWFLGSSGRLVNCGGMLVADATPQRAVADYFDMLRRLKCQPSDGIVTDRRRKEARRA